MQTEISLHGDGPEPKHSGGSHFIKAGHMNAIVLLSGGMDSAVALYWAAKTFRTGTVRAIFFDYDQRAAFTEAAAAVRVWHECQTQYKNLVGNVARVLLNVGSGILISKTSIQGYENVDQYENVQQAVENTSSDKSYLPMRNAILTTIASHHLLVHHPKGGHIVLGTRGRLDGPGGFPDCTNQFSQGMSEALTIGAGVPVTVVSPLNSFAPSREKTIQLAQGLQGCMDALKYTVSCYLGVRCGKCLPCLRRAQAFEAVGIKDPAERA